MWEPILLIEVSSPLTTCTTIAMFFPATATTVLRLSLSPSFHLFSPSLPRLLIIDLVDGHVWRLVPLWRYLRTCGLHLHQFLNVSSRIILLWTNRCHVIINGCDENLRSLLTSLNFQESMRMTLGLFTALAKVKVFQNTTFVSDSNNWRLSTTITSDVGVVALNVGFLG